MTHDADIFSFVEASMGPDAAQKLRRIKTGGHSNQRGHQYEEFFAVAAIIKIAATEPSTELFFVDAQPDAFIDDLRVRDLTKNSFRNYQLKDSPTTSKWSEEFETRCRDQLQIDHDHHQVSSSKQIIVCSHPNIVAAEARKIPEDLKHDCSYEHFPSHESLYGLLSNHQELRDNVYRICGKPLCTSDLSLVDQAFKLVLAAWTEASGLSVSKIMDDARGLANPKIFADSLVTSSAEEDLPNWLASACSEWDIEISIEPNSYKLVIGGFTANLAKDVRKPRESELESIKSKLDLVELLLRLSGTTLGE